MEGRRKEGTDLGTERRKKEENKKKKTHKKTKNVYTQSAKQKQKRNVMKRFFYI